MDSHRTIRAPPLLPFLFFLFPLGAPGLPFRLIPSRRSCFVSLRRPALQRRFFFPRRDREYSVLTRSQNPFPLLLDQASLVFLPSTQSSCSRFPDRCLSSPPSPLCLESANHFFLFVPRKIVSREKEVLLLPWPVLFPSPLEERDRPPPLESRCSSPSCDRQTLFLSLLS